MIIPSVPESEMKVSSAKIFHAKSLRKARKDAKRYLGVSLVFLFTKYFNVTAVWSHDQRHEAKYQILFFSLHQTSDSLNKIELVSKEKTK